MSIISKRVEITPSKLSTTGNGTQWAPVAHHDIPSRQTSTTHQNIHPRQAPTTESTFHSTSTITERKPLIRRDHHPQPIGKIWSVNEWGRLEEIILGNPQNAFLPSMQDISHQNFDRPAEEILHQITATSMPQWIIEETLEDLEAMAELLTRFGVVVHRSDSLHSTDPIRSPYWIAEPESAINIRDLTLIHGNLVIDAPSPTRKRYYEGLAVRGLFDQYRSQRRDSWFVAPPRPKLFDDTYDLARPRGINNTEPLFDAANCIRLGSDVIIDINNTANRVGAEWIQQALDHHYGETRVKVHPVSLSPDHLDVIIVPLCEGVAVINPKYVDRDSLPACLSNWKLIESPAMVPQPFNSTSSKASNWIGLNLLVLDGTERTVIVEERQLPLIRQLEKYGFQPVPVRWRHGRTWGGSFHCVTLDVHRLGVI